MPIEIYWLLKHRVTYYKYIGDVSLNELSEAAKVGVGLLEESSHVPLVHTIQNGEQLTSFPRNLIEVNKLSKSSMQHERTGWMIFVSVADPITEFVATMAAKIARSRNRFSDNNDEALTFLNYVDSTLPDLNQIDRDNLELVRVIADRRETASQ